MPQIIINELEVVEVSEADREISPSLAQSIANASALQISDPGPGGSIDMTAIAEACERVRGRGPL